MKSTREQALLDEVKALPSEQVAEVEDFVDFLHARTDAQQLIRAASSVAESAFKSIWDDPDDAVYDWL